MYDSSDQCYFALMENFLLKMSPADYKYYYKIKKSDYAVSKSARTVINHTLLSII